MCRERRRRNTCASASDYGHECFQPDTTTGVLSDGRGFSIQLKHPFKDDVRNADLRAAALLAAVLIG